MRSNDDNDYGSNDDDHDDDDDDLFPPSLPPYVVPPPPTCSSNPVFCINRRALGRQNLLPLVPAPHKKAPIPVVNPRFMVSMGLGNSFMVSYTAKDGRRGPPGTLKNLDRGHHHDHDDKERQAIGHHHQQQRQLYHSIILRNRGGLFRDGDKKWIDGWRETSSSGYKYIYIVI